MGLMITYSTNWMGPVSTRWYEDRRVPFEWRETSGKIFEKMQYKHYLESYSCGRIDIYGLDEQEHWCGRSEYSVAPMRTEDWNELSDYLDKLESTVLLTYTELISDFEKEYGRGIRWSIKDDNA